MARISSTLEIGDAVRIEVGGKMRAGRVEHLSFRADGKNQVLIRTARCGKRHSASSLAQETCKHCPTYHDEDDVERVVDLV